MPSSWPRECDMSHSSDDLEGPYERPRRVCVIPTSRPLCGPAGRRAGKLGHARTARTNEDASEPSFDWWESDHGVRECCYGVPVIANY